MKIYINAIFLFLFVFCKPGDIYNPAEPGSKAWLENFIFSYRPYHSTNFLYWSENDTLNVTNYVYRMHPDGTGKEQVLVIPNSNIIELSVDPSNDTLYFSDAYTGVLGASKIGSNVVVPFLNLAPSALLIDATASLMYYSVGTDLNNIPLAGGSSVNNPLVSAVYISKVDKTLDTLFFLDNSNSIRSLPVANFATATPILVSSAIIYDMTIDSDLQKIYEYEVNVNYDFYSMNLDGSGKVILFSLLTGVDFPDKIAYDKNRKTLFYSDSFNNYKIKSSDLQGGNVILLYETSNIIQSLKLVE